MRYVTAVSGRKPFINCDIKCRSLPAGKASLMKHIAIGENHLYSKAYAKGKKFVAHNVIVYVLKDLKSEKLKNANPMKEHINRIGLTVSKKLGGAVVRNRVKRILREGLRQAEKKFDLKKGYLIVLVARNTAVTASSVHISKDLARAFISLDMINHDEKNS